MTIKCTICGTIGANAVVGGAVVIGAVVVGGAIEANAVAVGGGGAVVIGAVVIGGAIGANAVVIGPNLLVVAYFVGFGVLGLNAQNELIWSVLNIFKLTLGLNLAKLGNYHFWLLCRMWQQMVKSTQHDKLGWGLFLLYFSGLLTTFVVVYV